MNIDETNLIKKLTWSLCVMSITSCMIRNDYNVLISFMILVLSDKITKESPKFYMKIILHLLVVLICVDVLWLIVISPYWSSVATNKNLVSLSFLHTIVIVLAYLEMFVKIAMGGLLFIKYKNTYANAIQDLISLTYDKNETISDIRP